MFHRLLFCLLIVALLAVPNVAFASREGRKNTAILLGAATVYKLSQGRGTEGVILAAGTYHAYKRYKDSKGKVRYRRVKFCAPPKHKKCRHGCRLGHRIGRKCR